MHSVLNKNVFILLKVGSGIGQLSVLFFKTESKLSFDINCTIIKLFFTEERDIDHYD